MLVPGLWTPAFLLIPLQRRLQQGGFKAYRFAAASRKLSPAENARRLGVFLAGLDQQVIHLVGHSLGGIILLHVFEQGYSPGSRKARIVLLACPVAGSALAGRLVAGRFARLWGFLLGRSVERGLLGDAPQWSSPCLLASFSGRRSHGIASVLFSEEFRGNTSSTNHSDGVLQGAETRLTGATECRALDVSHAGFLWSPVAATAVLDFLRNDSLPDA